MVTGFAVDAVVRLLTASVAITFTRSRDMMRTFLVVVLAALLAASPLPVAAQHIAQTQTYQIGKRPLPPAQAKLMRMINIGSSALNGAVVFNILSGYLGVVSWIGWSMGLAASSAASGAAGHYFYQEPTY